VHILTRKSGEWVYIEPRDDAPPDMTLKDLFANGPIRILVGPASPQHIKLAIDAPAPLRIWRVQVQGR
jgi:sRNA-binding carbon storage regulator CsrA